MFRQQKQRAWTTRAHRVLARWSADSDGTILGSFYGELRQGAVCVDVNLVDSVYLERRPGRLPSQCTRLMAPRATPAAGLPKQPRKQRTDAADGRGTPLPASTAPTPSAAPKPRQLRARAQRGASGPQDEGIQGMCVSGPRPGGRACGTSRQCRTPGRSGYLISLGLFGAPWCVHARASTPEKKRRLPRKPCMTTRMHQCTSNWNKTPNTPQKNESA